MPRHTFGELLRLSRQRADLTIEGLSERSAVSDRTISDIERGVSAGPQRRTVIALADALDLRGDERADFLGAARPGRRGAVTDAGHISIRPFRLADFSGREAEMGVLAALLEDAANPATTPILVTGAAGAGKTTVALEALHRATADATDILFLNLRGFAAVPLSPLQVLQGLLRQTRAHEEPTTMEEAAAAWRRATLGGRLAVLLDNAEGEAQVRPVLSTSDPIRLLVTARRSLAGLEGSRRVVLLPLRRPDSVDFLRRMIPAPQQARGDLTELADLCANLPLALRIATNRITSRPAWTVDDYVRRLRADSTRLRHLVAGDLKVEPALALSYEALTLRSRRVFRSLSLLTGSSFRADMVAAIDGGDVESTREILDDLTDLALLEPLSGDRYRLHDLLRIFAGDRHAASHSAEETESQRARLRDWTLDKARAMASFTEEDDVAAGPGDLTLAEAREWLISESGSWLAALTVASEGPIESQRRVLDTAAALINFAERWLGFVHWRDVARIALSASVRLADDTSRARLLHMTCALELALFDGDADLALQMGLHAREYSVQVGNAESAAWALIDVAWAETRRGENAAAVTAASRALEEALSLGSTEAQVQSRYWIATVQLQHDPEAALREAIAMRTTLDEAEAALPMREWNVANGAATAILAKALLALGRFAEAVDVANRIFDDASFFPHEPDFLARAHRHRGFGYLGLNEHEKARSDLQRALDLLEEHERPDWWAAEIQDALDALGPG